MVLINPTGGKCPTCPKGSEYDRYRNTDQLFNFADGIVFNGEVITINGTAGFPLKNVKDIQQISNDLQSSVTLSLLPTEVLVNQGHWIGKTSKGDYRLYNSNFKGNQFVSRTNILKRGGAVGLALNVTADATVLYNDPDYLSQFLLNTGVGVASLYLQPQMVVMIIVLQNTTQIHNLMHGAIQAFGESAIGQATVKGIQEMGKIDNYTRIRNSENMFGIGGN